MAQSVSEPPGEALGSLDAGDRSVSRRLLRWGLLLVTIALIAVWSLAERPGPVAGGRVPGLQLTVVSAREPVAPLDLSAIGQPTVVEVFASWCGVCRQGTPRVAQLALAHRAQPVRFIGVSVDRSAAAARTIVTGWGVDYTVLHDSRHELARLWNITAVPTFVIADARGRIEGVIVGMPSPAELERHLAAVGAPRVP